MSILLKNFAFSAKEFKSIKSIVAAALLIALHTVLAVFVSIQVTPTLRISVSFLANCAIGYMFGPVMGFVCGGLGDLIQFVIKPTGAYFPGWTISAALAGFIYGLFFYGCNMKVAEKYDEQSQKKGKLRSSLVVILGWARGWRWGWRKRAVTLLALTSLNRLKPSSRSRRWGVVF